MIAPAVGVQSVFVQVSGGGDLRLVALNDVAVAGEALPLVRVNLMGAPQAPSTLDLAAPGGQAITVSVQDQRLGLPDAGLAVQERPEWMAAAPFNDISDSTVVAHTVTLAEQARSE